MKKVHIRLEEQDYKTLISGEELVIKKDGIELHIILDDLGWTKMIDLVIDYVTNLMGENSRK